MAIAPDTVYTKTAKGLLEMRNKAAKLPRDTGQLLLSVDGKASLADLLPASGMTMPQLQHALTTLVSDGYIRAVASPQRDAAAASDDMDLDFTSKQAMASVNAEAASRALAAADAAKRAQAEARAALDARMRLESEARARSLAEARVAAEAEARAKAEHAAREAGQERERAEREALAATDAAQRAEAEARARSAAAAAVRAEAEARARTDAEQRAQALVEAKRAAEDEAREEIEQRAKAEEQAQARAAAEARTRELLEAQMQAMQGAQELASDPDAAEAEAARARVREIEAQAERARTEARELAAAEGRADEVPQPELDIADRVRQLNARVQAERRARELANRSDSAPLLEVDSAAAPQPRDTWSSLQVQHASAVQPVTHDLAISLPDADAPSAETSLPAPASPSQETALPEVDLDRAQLAHRTPEHVPSALEAAMAAVAARGESRGKEVTAPEAQRETTMPTPSPAVTQDVAAATLAPKLDDEDEPIKERLNVDRTAHDIIAEAAEARRKAEAAQLSHRAAAARKQRIEEEARRVEFAAKQKRRKKLLWGGAAAFVLVVAVAVAWLQFAPINGYRPAVQQALAERLNQPVTVGTVRYVMIPSPRLVVERIAIGEAGGVRVRRVQAHVSPFAALAGAETIDTAEIEGVEIDPPMLGTLPAWTGGRPGGAIQVNRLDLSDVRIRLQGAELEPFGGSIAFAPNGTITAAVLNNSKARVELTPSAEGLRVALDATGWSIPYGPPLSFDRLKLSGLIDQRQVAAAEFSGTVAAGTLEGALNVRWTGPIALQGEFKLENAHVEDLLAELTRNFSARGTLTASGRFSMQGADWTSLPAQPQIDGSFSVARGELMNIDLVRAMRSPAVGALRGGRTQFETLSGSLQIAGGNYVYRQLQLASGALNASGALDVSGGGRLAGQLDAALASRGGVVARSRLSISGTVQDPQLRR